MTAETSLKLLTRQGCHLCDVVAETLTDMGLAFATIDVDGDAELQQQYGEAVPVLLNGYDQIAAAPLTERDLRRALEGAGIMAGRG
jgi:glutaredoxin